MIEFKFDHLASIDKLVFLLARFSKRVFKLVNDTLAETTDKTAVQLRAAILLNKPDLIGTRFRSISTSWRSEKRRKGWREETLVRKELYAKAIRTRHEDDTHTIFLPDENYPGHNFTYKDLGDWLEHGTRTVGAIPHWRPAERWLRKQFRIEIRKKLKDAVLLR